MLKPTNYPSNTTNDHKPDIEEAEGQFDQDYFEFLNNHKASLEAFPKKNISKFRILKSGLYFTGTDDLLKCFHCKAEFGDWEEGDDPIEAHKILVPECEFIDKVETPQCLPKKSGPPDNDGMAVMIKRLETFANWPPAIKQSIHEMADAGFYYTGIGDRVACFYCGGKLKDWMNFDNPWVEHAKWFPACHYLNLVMGRKFIDCVVNEKPYEEEKVDEKMTISNILTQNCSCGEHKRDTCLIPCGHVVCENCSFVKMKCPQCKKCITNIVKIFNC